MGGFVLSWFSCGITSAVACRMALDKYENGEYDVETECSKIEEDRGLLQVIYINGVFYNKTTLKEVRKNLLH